MRILVSILMLTTFVLVSCSHNSSTYQANVNYDKQTALSIKKDLPPEFVPKEINIVSVGDSLTEGIGDSTKKGGYVPYLKEMLEMDKGIKDANIVNYGVKGNRSDQLLKKLGTYEVKTALNKADIVIVTIGGNDVMKVVRENFTNLHVSAFEKQKAVYEENLLTMINNIRKENHNSIIVLIGLYNPFNSWFANISEFNEVIDNWNNTSKKILAQYTDTYFVKVDDIFLEGGEQLLYTDYFHPNDKGYELIAGRVHDTLTDDVFNQPNIPAYRAENEGNVQ